MGTYPHTVSSQTSTRLAPSRHALFHVVPPPAHLPALLLLPPGLLLRLQVLPCHGRFTLPETSTIVPQTRPSIPQTSPSIPQTCPSIPQTCSSVWQTCSYISQTKTCPSAQDSRPPLPPHLLLI